MLSGMIRKSPPIGGYELGQRIDLSRLSEVSEAEYGSLGRKWPDEKIYRGPGFALGGSKWDFLVGVRGSAIFKLAGYFGPTSRSETGPALRDALDFCKAEIGEPTRRTDFGFAWATIDDNVLLETPEGGGLEQVNLVVTSPMARNSREAYGRSRAGPPRLRPFSCSLWSVGQLPSPCDLEFGHGSGPWRVC
jgi:hypothetical protein